MDERNMAYRAIFTHSDDKLLSRGIKNAAESVFVDVRNEAIKFLNPHYEEWNAEYNKTHENDDMDEYYAFIQRKQNEILDEFNSKTDYGVKLHSDEECDIVGKYHAWGQEHTIRMRLEPIGALKD